MSFSNWNRETLAFALGCLSVAAFAPFGIHPVIVVALAVLFWCWHEQSPLRCARIGFAYGFGLFIVGISWLYISVRNFGHAPAALAIAVVIAVAAAQAAIIAAAGYLQALATNLHALRYLLLIPSLWVMSEWVRGWLFTGFPWLYVGHSQSDTWLAGWVPYLGALGASFALCLCAGALALLALERSNAAPGRLLALVFALLPWAGGAALASAEWVRELPNPVSAALIQADVSMGDKFDSQSANRTLKFFIETSAEAYRSDLVIWPETALAYSDEQLSAINFWERLKTHPAHFIVGVLDYQSDAGDAEPTVYNSVFGIGEEVQVYRKSHLVPFGEYVPFRNLLRWTSGFVQLPGDMTPYDAPQGPLDIAGQKVGVTVCYETAFSDEVLKSLPEATMLVNVSEDAWFGSGIAPYQQLQIARMRSLETGRPLLRAANQGVSAAIDHRGQIIASLAQRDGKVLDVQIRPVEGMTPFTRIGHALLAPGCAIAILICFGLARLRRSPA